LSTGVGKAEVLLTPGVFLRVGEQSQIRLVSPSLTHTQVEVSRGEVMLEATGLVKDQSIQITDHGSSITVSTNGLYRFTADDRATAAVLDGKASITLGNREINLKKGKQVVLAANSKPEKFDRKKEDKLYAWSKVRSEYEAAATYRVSQSAYNSSSGRWRGFGYNGFSGSGWYWTELNSWAWLPGAGAFYSPFGYGFYSPAMVMNAPVVIAPIYRDGLRRDPIMTQVPINPNNPAAVGMVPASPWANDQARMAAARSMMESGMRTGSGAPVPNYGPASERIGGFGADMPGGRIGGPGNMSMGNSGGPASMPINTAPSMPGNSGNPGGMPGGNAGGPPPTPPPSGGGNPGGMPGGSAGGPPHQ
jgi:FecR protein